ncbi:hypothetical protein D7036_13550 [Aquimarina sp. BL5]|uniref:leucine-rich repeat domain-containing protein n=1 Tax=Aquimarina sp. BL5 TaxID=1714860 RepID=UPI000EA891AF|nr:hypothetical protein [Aquimarina sp. BL5]RKN03595.1 hypothetical protein D7036_13550 [Aquimarina sp. BL5]
MKTLKCKNIMTKHIGFIVMSLLLSINSYTQISVSPLERQALIDLYNATDGDNWKNTKAGDRPWKIKDPSSSIALWKGIRYTSNGLGGYTITHIDLRSNNLTGTLPNSIGNLKGLLLLDFTSNMITSSLPKELGALTSLYYLRLGSNKLTGDIPKEIRNLKSLLDLDLRNNKFSVNLPPEIGELSSLQFLKLTGNKFTGSIPKELGQLTNLEDIDLFGNNFIGLIPDELGNLSSLQYIDFSSNNLSGTIPSTLGQLSNLVELRLGFNPNLGGSIPLELGQLSKLENLELTSSNFKGFIPSQIAQFNSLKVLFVNENNFVFSDLEGNHELLKNKLGTRYSFLNQAKVDQTESLSVSENGTITLSSTALTSLNNSYQWYKDGVAITGATNKNLVISGATTSDAGVYHFTATNSIVTGLTLERNPITLTVEEDTCGVSAAEKQALIDLYNATDGANWKNNTNWLTDAPVCDWYGVTVEDGKIVEVAFFDNNLVGEIPSSIGNLKSLRTLDVYSNKLSGIVPVEIGNLLALKELFLSGNNLSGNIPKSLGNLHQLLILDAHDNNLYGEIPIELGSLQSLQTFSIADNKLTGSIPRELGQLTNLKKLFLYNNQLVGVLPVEVGNLKNLKSLSLYMNKLSGVIPKEYGNLTNLKSIDLHSNQLSGELPEELNSLELKDLFLQNNRFSGEIPSGFTNFTSLTKFFFENNSFVFSDFESEYSTYQNKLGVNFKYAPQAKVDQTESLSVTENGSITLSSNALTSLNNSYQWYKDGVAITGETNKDLVISGAATADAGVYHFTSINSVVTGLTLERNPITLTVIEDTCGVSAIEKQALIDLYNATDGPNWTYSWDLDTPVCDWYGVRVFDGKVTIVELRYNNLNGTIPSTLENLSNLRILNLGKNKLSGNVPIELGNLTELTSIFLSSNELSGTIPSELGKLSKLVNLQFQNNKFTGTIPVEIGNLSNLAFLQLHKNLLTGTIPIEVGNLSQLKQLFLSENQLSGDIPVEIGSLTNLQQLYLYSNKLSGVIPKQIGRLINLKHLYIYDNKLENRIPTELGNQLSLERLNISNNKLFGEIPKSIKNLPDLKEFRFQVNDYVFSDFESEYYDYKSKLDVFIYIPQAKVDQTETLSVTEGGTITLSSTALTSTNNSYQWYKDGIVIPGATNKEYVIENASATAVGSYHFIATNSIVTDLTLERNPISLTLDPCGVSEVEKQALIDLYNATDGVNWTNNTNWLTDAAICDWHGVTVVDGKITRLDLSSNKLSGTIPSTISDFTSLVSLRLDRNTLTGEIPINIETLNVLEELYLNYNELTGAIPSGLEIITTLEVLHLDNNKLTGTIPENIGQLVNLRSIGLSNNQLEGEIPVSISNITGLKYLRLENNRFAGNIPNSIGTLTELVQIGLDQNAFSGQIPQELTNLPNLNYLNIANNELNGVIPNFTLTPKLTIFAFNDNGFIFSDFESEFDAYTPKFDPNFVYKPQAKVDQEQTIRVQLGGSVILSTQQLSSPNNTYTWYRGNNQLITTADTSITIDNITQDDIDEYYFVATNSIVDGLELERNKIKLVLGLTAPPAQKFCNTDNPIFIRDLTSPFTSPANWSFRETEQLMISPDYEITSTITLWAESVDNPLEPRIAVQIVINEGIPRASQTTQYFLESMNPVINDIIVNGTNILWFDSVTSNVPLSGSLPLEHNTYYYAQQKDKECRLKILVKINSANTDCNILLGVADGGFENCYATAGIIGTAISNNDLTCSNFDTPRNLMYTWKIGIDNQRSPGEITNLVQPSPEGAVFASCRVYQPQSQFPTRFSSVLQKQLDNLEIGSEYKISFYQSNGGYFGITSEFNASWKVSWGNDRIETSGITPVRSEQISTGGIDIGVIPSGNYQVSPPMIVKTGFSINTLDTPTWDLVEIKFTATNATQTIKFTPVVPTLNTVDNGVLMHLLIDGIKVTKVDGDCVNNSEAVNFCNTDNPIFVRDLASPFPGETNWSFTETEQPVISPDYEITSTVTLWAQSKDNPLEPRVPVQVIINEGIPTASQTTQYFLEATNPVINDIIVNETNILWFDSVISSAPLSGSLPLEHNTYYYAQQKDKECRLKILVNIIPSNPDPDQDCNILDEYVNGTFEDCSSQASWYGHNGKVTCGNWVNGRGTADTWNIPFKAHSGIADNIPDSPDGGVVAGAIARSTVNNELESFYTSLENLEIGAKYTVKFYQSNVTGTFTSNGGMLERGRWKVLFGDQKLFSSYMLVTKNPVWEEASLEFTATTSDIRLEFVASSAGIAGSASYVYMLIDGISLTKVGGTNEDCPQEVVYEEQKFCTMNRFPTVADLTAPGGGSSINWYNQEIGGYKFELDQPLGLGNGNTYVEVYWADSPDYTSRVPVKAVIDEGAPIGDSFQLFMVQNNPNVGDLQAQGTSIQWYDSSTGTVPLPANTLLVDGGIYYAASTGVICRLAVEVKLTNAPAEANSWQAFCSSINPTISNIQVKASNTNFEIKWFAESEGGLPLSPSTSLQNNTLYYAGQFSGGIEISDRTSVFIVFIQSPPPLGPAQQVFESDQSATVGDLIAFGNNIRWFDGNDTELSNDLVLENGGIYYAKQTSVFGKCLSDTGLAVQVVIQTEEPPVYVDCEKFRPEPGKRYVMSAWVRENGATISSTKTKSFQEIKGQFLDLVNSLKDRILDQIPTPSIFDPSPEERKYDDIIPFINATNKPTNLKIYDLKPYRENQSGIKRTVGFSFSLDPDGQTEILYKTPNYGSITYNERIPILEEPLIEFDNLEQSGINGNIILNSMLIFRSDLIPAIYRVDVNVDIGNAIKPLANFNTYVDTSDYQVMNYENSFIQIIYTDRNGSELTENGTITFRPQGNIIDGWQRISSDFTIPDNAEFMTISLKNSGENLNVYYDDIRFQPFDSSMKTFVYDPENLRLQSELDENNYSTFYEYDLEGGLVRVKKETERGTYTIQETRSGSSLLNND